MLWLTLAAVGTAAAAYVYLVRERLGMVGGGLALLRSLALVALLALLANLAVRHAGGAPPVTVALDASLSMGMAAPGWRKAVDTATMLAGRGGTVVRFGSRAAPLDSLPPVDGRSLVADVLRLAAARGGPAVLVTDGELEDFALLSPELRAGTRLVLLPRAPGPGLAVTEAAVPARVLTGDSIPIAIELTTWGPLADSVGALTLRAGERVLLRREVSLPPAPGRGRRTVTIPPGVLPPGTHVLAVAVRAAGDPETRDDERLRIVEVSDLPAAVLVASPLDWEARFLARELSDLVPGGVQAFGDLGGGRWVNLDTQMRTDVARVERAVRGASLVLARGDVPAVARSRRLWRWPPGGETGLQGDWYVSADVPPSPLVTRLAGLEWDSVPPLRDVVPLDVTGWQPVLTARLGRRGAERVVLATRDSAGRRELVTAAGGLWRWAFRGGAHREVYRSTLAAGVEWLLGGAGGPAASAVRAEPVVPQGVPVTFRWMSGDPAPDSLSLELTGPDSSFTRLAVVGAERTADVLLPPGVYRWRVPAVARVGGTVAVETYSAEFVPRTVVHQAAASPGVDVVRIGLRELWWGFGLAMLAFLLEWAWRLRRGLP